MSNLLERASQRLAERRDSHMSSPVTYCIGSDRITMQAAIGKTEHEWTDADGLFHVETSQDFIVQATDMVNDGSPITPLKGHRIQTAAGVYYDVNPYPGDPLPWRWTDGFRNSVRVFTKEGHA